MTTSDRLIEAIKAGDLAAVRHALDESGGLLPAPSPGVDPPLLTAIYHRSQPIINLLLAAGAEPDLFEAAALGDVRRIRSILAQAPLQIRAHSYDGWTALHLAAHYGQREAMEALLRAGADPRAVSTNRLRNTALHAALAGGQTEAAERLLEAGIDVNTPDANGHTALHLAAEDGSLAAISLLLNRGANVRASNKGGMTPLDFAVKQGNAAAQELLRRAGASP
jgi:ankyrin repeat protein